MDLAGIAAGLPRRLADRLLALLTFGLRGMRFLRRRGDAARDRRDWPAACEAYRRALTLEPNQPPIWVQLGHALKEGGDPEAALAAYSHALALMPAVADTHLSRGHALKLLGRRKEARAAYRRAAELDPADPHAAGELAEFARQDAAEASAVTAAAAETAEALLLAAERHEAVGRLTEAENALQQARRRLPGDEQLRQRHAALRRRMNARARRMFILTRGAAGHGDLPFSLRFVAFGTTGLCNASCLHCPTGKAETDHVPRQTMPMPLFRRSVEIMAELDLVVRTQISFGLFGDALLDPHVVERAALIADLLPDAYLSVNTNGAAYSPERHRALATMNGVLALHVESLIPETYNTLMAPLRLERMLPKFEQILADFPGKVHVSVPVSRLNRAELPAIQDWFRQRGAARVAFDGLSSRCAEDRTRFDSLALNPVPIRCRPEALDDLVIDCDGLVLICCQDFRRSEPIGDLRETHLADVLIAAERQRARVQFAHGLHHERRTCSRCFGDPRMDHEAALRVAAPAA
jgi:tetratricopeptide (TPR) repeat protein